MAWCAVIGDPIEHSLSPVIHLAAYRSLEETLEYRKYRVDPQVLPEFLASLADCRGLSVTMPLKEEVQPHLDRIDGLAKVTGAVNTIVPAPSGMLLGFNTDVYGIVAAYREAHAQRGSDLDTTVRHCLILGAGATAASAIAAAIELGATTITIAARKPRQIMVAAHRMGVDVQLIPLTQVGDYTNANEPDFIISTLPAHAADDILLSFTAATTLLDVSYAPWPSVLVQRAEQMRATIVPGIAMLVHQACQQVSLFTSRYPDPRQMYQALRDHGVDCRWPSD